MKRLPILALFLGLSFAGVAAAEDVDDLLGKLTGSLSDLEINLTTADTQKAENDKLTLDNRSLNEQRAFTNQQVQQNNAVCNRTFQPEEAAAYASCSAQVSQLNARQVQIDTEFAAVDARGADLNKRARERASKLETIVKSLDAEFLLIEARCSALTAEEQARRCHAPAAPGSHTGTLTANLESELAKIREGTIESLNQLKQLNAATRDCVNLPLERMVECARAPFDGSVYDPSKPDVTPPNGAPFVVTPNAPGPALQPGPGGGLF